MTIVYHGDKHGTTNLDPRWMLHKNSSNMHGVGIYFADNIYLAEDFGPKICSIDIDGLNLIKVSIAINKLERTRVKKFLHYLHKTKSYSKFSMRKEDQKFWMNSNKKSKAMIYATKLSQFFSKSLTLKEFEEFFEETMNYNMDIEFWQFLLAIFYGYENIIEFVHGWNKIMKIDGLYSPGPINIFSIIQTNVKVTPVNF